MSRYPLKIGDIFVVPVADGQLGVGQVVAKYGKDAFYLAIFDEVVRAPTSIDLERVPAARIVFLALSMDAKFAAGHWTVVGQRPVRVGLPLPAFKEAVGFPPRFDVVDYSGERRRPARSSEVEFLSNRKVVAPVRLEKALRAKHGLEPWLAIYSDLAPDELRTTQRFFN